MQRPSAVAVAALVDACRSCGGASLVPFLDLGTTPVANALLVSPDAPAPEFPLQVGFCHACALVQLLHVLPAEHIFGADYPYFSSYSDILDAHSQAHVTTLRAESRTGPGRLVVEVASNDGYLLRHLLGDGARVLGIEPSPGPAAAARTRGIETLEEFLDPATAASVVAEHGRADVVLANNVMAHVPDLRGFVRALGLLLAEDGVLHVENPGVDALLEHVEFDTVYHEHYCYFSTTAVDHLMRAEGLHLNDVERFPDLHGGTLRWVVSHRAGQSERLRAELAEERIRGLDTEAPYLAFARRVTEVQQALRSLLSDLRASGATIAGYGAAAKGATLLNSTGIDVEWVEFVVDRNPNKQGRWVPGARIPVVDPAELLARQPSHLLVLAWNVASEVRRQQAEYERRGGRFILPIPWPTVLSPEVSPP